MVFKNRFMVSFIAAFISALLLSTTPVIAKPVEKIEHDKSHADTIRDILAKLQSRHYREMRVDDTLSSRYLDNYLATLDPSRMFFYDKDISAFKEHEAKFDDYFKNGDLGPAFDIYHVYRQRVISRLELVSELLSDPTVKFDFASDEEVMLERDGEPWPQSLAEADKLWHKRVQLSLLNLKMAGKTLEEASDIVSKRYKRQLKRVTQEDSDDVFETIANALTMLYDPHTNYWSPRTTENFNINMRLSLEGIGAVLQSEEEFTKVVRLVAGGPADKQGQLKPADRIISVGQGEDGELVDVVGWRLEEVVELIRGPRNTLVKLEVTRDGAKPGENKTIRINRDQVKLEDQAAQSAIMKVSDGKEMVKLGVINLPTFYVDFDAQRQRKEDYRSSSKDVERLLKELMKEGIDGLVLDLRNNGGGSLQEAVSLTDLFIDQGPVVQIRTPDDRINRHHRSRYKAQYEGPLIVLVNRLSASASEIFAGAIQDYNRGIIVGAQTFGKGTVQSVNPLVEGGLKITESKFYRVSGDSTQHRGIIPDVQIPFLIDPEQVGESSYDNALPWDQIHPVPHLDYYDFSSILPLIKNLHGKRTQADPDFNYLLDQVNIMEKNKSKKTVSLNEKKRIKEKEELELEAMNIENKRRAAKKMELFKTLADFRAYEEEEDEAAEQEPVAQRSLIDVDGDTILIESGSILLDVIRLSNKAIAEKQSFAHSRGPAPATP